MTAIKTTELQKIVDACRDESTRERYAEEGFCVELFRRAVDEANDEAWRAILQQYNPLICKWIVEVTTPNDGLVAQELADEAFSRFWRTLQRSGVELAQRFDHIGAILKYLRQCCVTTVLDHRRRVKKAERIDQDIRHAETRTTTRYIEDAIGEQMERENMLRRIADWISVYVTDPTEKLVFSCSFEQELSPAEIAATFPDAFESAAEVRRIKERMLKRARRLLTKQ